MRTTFLWAVVSTSYLATGAVAAVASADEAERFRVKSHKQPTSLQGKKPSKEEIEAVESACSAVVS